MSSQTSFEESYKRLNKAQKQAVDSIEGPVMVVAGPGTGKTQILTLRIANILQKTDTQPENILALTFTDAGVKAMRERLHTYIGTASYRVPIKTFHSFSEQLIRDYPDSYTRVIGGRPASDIEKISLIESILDSGDIKLLRPMGNPEYYVRPILSAIQTMKREYITPEKCAEILTAQEKELDGIEKVHQKGAHKGKVRGEYMKKEKLIEKNRELFSAYRAYEALLTSEKLYDFDDMIVETVRALEQNEDMLRDLQETYQYVLADEHQDVNGSQNRILGLLASYHDAPNIFAVGDEKQAIYRFQGASLDNFLQFENLFKGTKMISLTENYRSGQKVLDAAHSLVAVDEGPLKELRVPLTSNTKEEIVVERRDFSHQVVEDSFIVSEIKEEIAKGTVPEDIAVIVRTNKEVEQLTLQLRRAGVVVAPSSDGDILEHPITSAVSTLIETVSNPADERALFQVVHGSYWGLSANDLVRILSAVQYDRPLVDILGNKKLLQELGVEHITEAMRIIEVLAEARKKQSKEAPHRTLEYILKESGFITYITKEDPFEGARVVRRLYDEIEEMVERDGHATLQSVMAVLKKRREYRLPLEAPYITTNTHAVQVQTAHKSKGLEFDVVFVPHLVDSLWGSRVSRIYFDIPVTHFVSETDFDALDDERRLLYVAMTRARTKLYLSSSETNAEGKVLVPSRLFDDIDEQFMEIISSEDLESSFEPLASFSEETEHVPVISAELLEHLLSTRGLSATALNNYLDSPWKYLYRNILRVPEVQSTHLQYGTALHGVMEKLTRAYTKGEKNEPSATIIKKALESELNRLPITTEEYTRLLERGLEALTTYVPYAWSTLGETTKEEFSVSVTLDTGDKALPQIKLTGKLDRLDVDQEGNVTRVIDYKTGRPKTRGQIEGSTKDSNGDYKRQLIFYTLLLSLYDDERYFSREGVLSFIEPNAKGEIKEEAFTITDEEVGALKKDIIRIGKEIATGAFLTEPCEKDSDYFVFVENLKHLL